jgi:hypothetical protein
LVSLNLNGKYPELTKTGSNNLPKQEVFPYQNSKLSTPNLASPKERLKKVLKKDIYILPDYINKDVWDAYLDMRKTIKKKPTDKAITMLLKKLDEYRQAGDDPNEILSRSVMNGWTGIFPLDRKGAQVGTHQQGGNRNFPRSRYTERP